MSPNRHLFLDFRSSKKNLLSLEAAQMVCNNLIQKLHACIISLLAVAVLTYRFWMPGRTWDMEMAKSAG